MNALLEATPDTPRMFYGHKAKGLGRILMVDDDESLRYLVTEVLIRAGYEVDAAENGARAWKALNLKSYDLLITDQDMPEMTGLQLIAKLRSAGFALPVVFASGRLASDLMAKSEWFGFAATVLPKPFTLDELIRTVRELMPRTASEFNTNPWQVPPNQAFYHENYANK